MNSPIDTKELQRLMRFKGTHYLLEHVIVLDNNKCWEWTGRKDKDGYGLLGIAERAHRIMYALSRRLKMPLPKGTVIRHTCDNTSCCNPWHLNAGTQIENVADRVERHRSASGARNGRAKLTAEQVATIRARKADGAPALSSAFNVDQKTIRDILSGKIWRQ